MSTSTRLRVFGGFIAIAAIIVFGGIIWDVSRQHSDNKQGEVQENRSKGASTSTLLTKVENGTYNMEINDGQFKTITRGGKPKRIEWELITPHDTWWQVQLDQDPNRTYDLYPAGPEWKYPEEYSRTNYFEITNFNTVGFRIRPNQKLKQGTVQVTMADAPRGNQ